MNNAMLVTKNLGRRKLRTTLMLVAIFIAFFLFACLESFKHQFYSSETAASADRLVTVNKINFTMPLPISYVERIRQMPGVLHATPQTWFGGYYQDPKEPLFMFAVDPQAYLDVYPAVQMAPAQRQTWLTERTALAVGRIAADKYHWKAGDHVPISSNIYMRANGSHSWEFTVAAVFTSPDDSAREGLIMMHHDYFDETVTFGRDQANMIIFMPSSPKLNDSLAKAVDASFANSPAETTTDTAMAFNKAFTAQLGNIALIISLVVATAFAAILLIVGNTMVMAVRERTREIGVLKTLGFTGWAICYQILAESLLLAVTGALLGLGTAALLIRLSRKMLEAFIGGMHFPPPVLFAGVGLALVLGLVTGAVPAWSGLRLRIATALGRR